MLPRAQGTLIKGLLLDKRVRTREGAFVIEGAKLCHEVFSRSPEAVVSLLVSPRHLRAEDEAARQVRGQLHVPQFTCPDDYFGKLSDVDTPQGILAVIRQPKWDENVVWSARQILGLYGDQIRDPLNVGAIIRTAAALNLSALWLSSDSADCFSPKVVRAAAGSVLAFPIFRVKSLQAFHEHHCVLYSAVVSGPDSVSMRSIHEAPSRLVIAVGNEGRGLSQAVLEASRTRFSIPLARSVDSLNVAATAAIAAYHFSGLVKG
jgi:TrmH family RNA methyltransferase